MIDKIQAPIATEVAKFDKFFKKEIQSNTTLLNIVLRYFLRKKGKRIRPVLVFLSAGLCGNINERTYRAALLVELLHTATLVHDDIVDEAKTRRGLFTINKIWKNKVAVLVGDFLLSKGMLVALKNKDYDLLHIVSQAVEQMSEGELLQYQKTRKLNMNYEEYFQIIEKKTASLLAVCCQVGAASSSDTEEEAALLKRIGLKLGLCFQIRDDLFDYETHAWSGKTFGLDFQNKKITLPLIYALSKSPSKTRREILRTLKERKKSLHSSKIIDFTHTFGGVEFARRTMQTYAQEAQQLLQPFSFILF